jgi:hypothetical protein
MDKTKSGQVGKDPYGSYPSGTDLSGSDPADRDPAGSYQAEQASAIGSIWQLKPWWCQPWSILLTGAAMILASWLGLHRLWITAPLSCAVLLWWWLFLLVVPASYRQQLQAERPGS